MATVNNTLGQEDIIKHRKGTLFDKTFSLSTLNSSTQVKSDFSLVNYDGVVRIKNKVDGVVLYSKTTDDAELTFATNTIRWNDLLDLNKTGELYFELEITLKTDAEKKYKPWYGKFYNIL